MKYKYSEFNDNLKAVLDDDLRELLARAENAARDVRIFARDRGASSYETIKAALDLAIAVWGEENNRRVAGQK